MSHSVKPTSQAASAPFNIFLAGFGLLLLAAVAYHNSFTVPFVFDDIPSIVENRSIQRLWPLSGVLLPDQAGGVTSSGRPVVNLSFALNYAISGYEVWSYHALNFVIHACAGVCMLGVVRRTLLTPALRPLFGRAALPLAFFVAALWTLHPLQTESVTYVVQRAESLAGLFYLLTLYAFIRSAEAADALGWWAAAFGACLLGVASKEVVISAPLIVLLYDRTFVSGTFRVAWSRNRPLYMMLGTTWIVVGLLIAATGSRGGTAGFGTEMSSWSYLLTQCRAIMRYLSVSLWPHGLVFDYGIGTARHLAEVLPYALFVVTLLSAVIFALFRFPFLAFLGGWFFGLLAPSSSIMPIATQTIAEHRMYLPLAAVIVLLVIGGYRLIGTAVLYVWTAAAIALAATTVGRNYDFRSEVAIWSDTTGKWPTNARAHNNLGQALFRAGKIADSITSYERALQLQPNYPETHYNLGVSLARLGRISNAIEHYEVALRLHPDYPEAHNNFGNALIDAGRIPEAFCHYERALTLRPDFAEAHNNHGNALLHSGRVAEAVASFQRALKVKPGYAEARYNLGNAFAAAGQMNEALTQYAQALKLKPDYAEAHVNAGNALLALERPSDAIEHYQRAVALAPQLADAHFNLGSVLLELQRWDEAIPPLETVLRVDANFTRAHRALGFALARIGRPLEAIKHYEQYVLAAPNDSDARGELAKLRDQAGGLR